jgi:hypothetical protein
MGKDFIPLIANNMDTKEAIKKLYHKNLVTSASKNEYFHVLPDTKEIAEIEIGDVEQGTHESIFRLKNDDFIVVNKTLPKRRKLKEMS